jgi:glycosyltransferase involved in cell wall biosynthesis
MRIAFVVQRYGIEVNGGAELHCRLIAEHIAKYYDVEVITTCAQDYMTWKDEYAEGIEEINKVKVRRFRVDHVRDVDKFNKLSENIFRNPHEEVDELDWMRQQGPYSAGMLNFIESNAEYYDFFIFFTYLYCTTFFGLPLVKEKALLVPTAHDEPPIYLSIFKSYFNLPRAIIYNTVEEKKFINMKFENRNILNDIVGIGIDLPESINPERFKKKYNLDNFIIYVGRIDESKGCLELFDYFQRYKDETNSKIKLVLLGKPVMKVPAHEDIISLGFVSEQDKFDGITASKLLVIPSKYESLSMVTMEAWLCNRAVLLNGNCEVLKGQAVRSNGGLWYQNYDEFKDCLSLMLSNSKLMENLSENGKGYVEKNYGWPEVEGKYQRLLERLKSSPYKK